MDLRKTRSQIVMESYLSGRVPEIHRLGIKDSRLPRKQSGRGASWVGRNSQSKSDKTPPK